jgi:hypothetical protein
MSPAHEESDYVSIGPYNNYSYFAPLGKSCHGRREMMKRKLRHGAEEYNHNY